MSVVALIQAIVREEMNRWHVGDLGVVTSVFPHGAADDRENYECNVLLKNAGLSSAKYRWPHRRLAAPRSRISTTWCW